MDWSAAVEKNREALKRILAMLVAMAGLGDAAFTSPLRGGRRSPDRRVGAIEASQPPPDASRRPPLKGEVKKFASPAMATKPARMRFSASRLKFIAAVPSIAASFHAAGLSLGGEERGQRFFADRAAARYWTFPGAFLSMRKGARIRRRPWRTG
jgi:hypothetical protein